MLLWLQSSAQEAATALAPTLGSDIGSSSILSPDFCCCLTLGYHLGSSVILGYDFSCRLSLCSHDYSGSCLVPGFCTGAVFGCDFRSCSTFLALAHAWAAALALASNQALTLSRYWDEASAPAPSWASVLAVAPPQVAIWATIFSCDFGSSAWPETLAPAPDWVIALAWVIIWALFCLQPHLRLLIYLQADSASNSCSGYYISSGTTSGHDFGLNSCLSSLSDWVLRHTLSSAPSWATASAVAPFLVATSALTPGC